MNFRYIVTKHLYTPNVGQVLGVKFKYLTSVEAFTKSLMSQFHWYSGLWQQVWGVNNSCLELESREAHCEQSILKITNTPITKLISQSLNENIFPNSWSCSVITLLFKSGDPAEIAHLSCSPFNLYPMQFDFRKQHSEIAMWDPTLHPAQSQCASGTGDFAILHHAQTQFLSVP